MNAAPLRPPPSPTQWRQDNAAYTDMLAIRLKLLLRRRALWLRRLWQRDDLRAYRSQLVSDAQAEWLLGGTAFVEAEQRFFADDAEAAAVASALRTTEERLRATARTMRESGRPPALDILADLFNLTPFETDLLVLAAAPAWDAGFERLFAYVHDDATRPYATAHLALTVFPGAGPPLHSREVLHASRPLRRFHLLEVVEGGWECGSPLLRPLRLDARVLDFLDGVNRCDERLRPLVHAVLPIPLSPDQEGQAAVVAERLANGAPTWPVVNLLGSTEGGADGVARAACDRIGTRLVAIELQRIATSSREERTTLYALLEREAQLSGWVYLIDASAITQAGDPAVTGVAHELVDRLCAMVVIVSRERWPAAGATSAVATPKPDRRSQRVLWRTVLAETPHALNGAVDDVAEQFDFGPRAIVRAAADARDRAQRRASSGDAVVSARDLWDACREVCSLALDDLALRIEPCFSWSDIVLPTDTLLQLGELAEQLKCRAQVYEAWGFGAQLGRGRGITALFSGMSGTGKTMAAEILARELGLDLYRIDLSGVVSKYIGETEKNLRRIFDAGGSAILFFDEADALFGSRSEVRDSHDRYANIEVNYLLQRMEDHTGVAILATNRKASLDAAFLRRLRFVIDFPFPDAGSRRRIWRQVFPTSAALDQLDLDVLSRWEIPGGNIRSIALNAAFLAASDGSAIGMRHVVRAAAREYRKIERAISITEFGPYAAQVRS